MITLKLDPQEIQLALNAIYQAQFYGKDAHTVSSTLKKFETKLESFKPVQG
jgi:hypothetical protein